MHDGRPWGVAVSAARTLTDADVAAIARAVVRELRDVKAAERKPMRDAEPEVSETDRAMARAIARRHGLHVRPRAKR